MAKCKKCGKEILWILTRGERWMPCDPDLKFIKTGSGHKFVNKYGEVIEATFAKGINDAEGTAYSPHWASCPYAEEFKRKRSEKWQSVRNCTQEK